LAAIGYFSKKNSEGWLEEYNKGVEYQQAGKIDLAEQQFKVVLQNNPECAEAHLNLGLIQMNRGWLDGAEKSTKKAMEILEATRKTFVKGATWEQPLSVAYNNLGAVEVKRGLSAEKRSDRDEAKKRWETAMTHFRKAAQLDPMNSLAQSNIERFKNAYPE
jgi:tetratricopeptide (TPR) repeat protein